MVQIAQPAITDAEIWAAEQVMTSKWVGSGPLATAFEDAVAAHSGYRHAIATTSGTAALHLTLACRDLGPGDEVLVPSFTFCATVQAVVACGATPVFVDIDDRTLCLDLGDAERQRGPRTRAIVPVQYAGCTVGSGEAAAYARDRGLWLVEDAAHAFGTPRTEGDDVVRCFSFGPTKPLTTGQGGAVVTDDDDLAARMRLVSDLGMERTSSGEVVVSTDGYRYRMHDLNAAIGPAQFRADLHTLLTLAGHPHPDAVLAVQAQPVPPLQAPYGPRAQPAGRADWGRAPDVSRFVGRAPELAQLDRWEEILRQREQLRDRYHERLDALGESVRRHDPLAAVPFSMTIRVPSDARARVRARLADRDIQTVVHYPPNHLQPAFCGPSPTSLPVTERVASEVVSLPFHPALDAETVDAVVAEFEAALA